jgi:hypothetical protein
MMVQFDSNALGNAAPIKEWIIAMEQAFIDTASVRSLWSQTCM